MNLRQRLNRLERKAKPTESLAREELARLVQLSREDPEARRARLAERSQARRRPEPDLASMDPQTSYLIELCRNAIKAGQRNKERGR